MLFIDKQLIKIALRFGNLYFIDEQIRQSKQDLFSGQHQILDSLSDSIATSLKKMTVIVSRFVVHGFFQDYFFQFLHYNFDGSDFQNSTPAEFHHKCSQVKLFIPDFMH